MTILAQTIVNDIRVMSGLRNNPLFSDAQICELVNDAYNELSDKFVAALEHWFRATASFTLSGNSPSTNSFDLSTLPDFQMDQGLNWLPSGPAGVPVPVQRLGSFAERGDAPLGIANLYGSRRYFTNGDLLFVEPYQLSAGQYTLIYTPQRVPLSVPAAIPASGATPATINAIGAGGGGLSAISFNNAAWDQSYVGASLVIANSSNGNNGTYAIASVADNANITVTGTLTAESSTAVTATVQAAGTTPALPALLSPWALFLKVHASIAIQTARKQPINDLQTKLAEQLARITAMAKKRSEGPQQAPITNRYWRRRRVGYWG